MAVDNGNNQATGDTQAASATADGPQPPPTRGSPRTFWVATAALCGVALLLRLAILDEFFRENVIAEWPWSDGEVYWKMAGRMAGGDWAGQTPFLSAPLYPYLLGLIRTLGGGLLSVYLLQLCLHLGTAALLGWTTRLRFGVPAGLLATGLFLLLTEPAVSSTRIMPNTLQLLLITVLWWRWAAAAERGVLRWPDLITTAALVGLLALGYSPAMLLIPLYGLWVWGYAGWRGSAIVKALVGVATALLLISPATLHNLVLHGEFIPITAHSGITLRQGNLPSSTGIGDVIPGISLRRDKMHLDAARVFQKTYGRAGTWREIDRHFRREAISYWLENPLAAFTLFVRKAWLGLTARNYDEIMPTVIERELGIGQRAILAPLAVPWLMGGALVGLVAVLRRPLRFAPEWILCLLPLLVVLAFFYAPRYRLPAVPLMCGLAAYALTHCRRLTVPTPVIVAVFLLPVPLYLLNIATGIDSPDFVRTYFTRALSEAQVLAGDRRSTPQEFSEAEERYRAAIELWDENFLAHQRLGVVYARQRRLDDAVRELSRAIRLNPKHLPSRFHLYNALRLQQRYPAAATTLREMTRLAPRNQPAHLALAWLLATCPDDRVRNGDEALQTARDAQVLTAGDDYELLDVLAAAHAELGQFEEAVRAGSAALVTARQQGHDQQAAEISRRVDRYRNRQPCRAEPRVLRPGSSR